ncbi:52K [Titi monkey adenovirus ECC-2011]|uniref:Packaging protein 3 n=1 Tax=titi monkey adenovirus 1 TaxID=3123084 RepID=G0ZAH8_9ADEN|nr:52K [Titi monkey adenovirus ECC-2011]AEK98449.1 52K [Titi monkey adenovirus ECC-2011]
MHPVLRQMKPPATATASYPPPPTTAQAAVASGAGAAAAGGGELTGGRRVPEGLLDEGEGLARLGAHDPERHPRVQLKRDTREAYVPRRNAFREREGQEPEEMRDLRFRAGRELHDLDRERVLRSEDFEVDPRTGVSPARAHVEAANLVSAYEETVKQEMNFQKSFNNHVRTLIAREEVAIGLMHLWDFVEAFVSNPNSKPLTAQLLLIVQHSRDNEVFREALLNIAEPEGRWLLDLINILQSIVVQERSLSLGEKVAAINYSMLSLGKHYARKIYKSPFVPIDKEVKIDSFYMRMALKVLTLSDDLGVYRNDRIHKAVSASRRRELSDRELMHCLHRALTSHGDERLEAEELLAGSGALRSAERQEPSYFDAGADLRWQPSHRAAAAAMALSRYGPPEAEEEEAGYEEYDDYEDEDGLMD